EARGQYLQRQGRRQEQRVPRQRLQHHVAQLTPDRRVVRKLLVALDLRGHVPRRGAPIQPVGLRELLAEVPDLFGGQNLGDRQHHVGNFLLAVFLNGQPPSLCRGAP